MGAGAPSGAERRKVMERQTLNKAELLNILNAGLAKLPDYQECRYEDVTKLDQPDETGCNWKDAMLRCSGMHPGTCQPAGFKILEEARKKYNLG
jgi:hypothetical protein